ncbi:hypothetical protein T31B1_05845 [Salinisphaera sp. T31B1]
MSAARSASPIGGVASMGACIALWPDRRLDSPRVIGAARHRAPARPRRTVMRQPRRVTGVARAPAQGVSASGMD